MTHAEFLRLAERYHLSHISQQLLSTTVPGIRALEEAAGEAKPGANTFIGGDPSPEPRSWPTCKERPLTFVAQVSTEALPRGICPIELPVGILQFFVPSTTEANDYEPSLDCGRVLFVIAGTGKSEEDNQLNPDDASTGAPKRPGTGSSFLARCLRFLPGAARSRRRSSLAPPLRTFPKRGFQWEVFPTLYESAPDMDSLWLPESAQHFEFNHDADWDNYFEFRREVMACPRWNWLVQMFGFPNQIQVLQDGMQRLVDAASGRRSLNEFKDWILLFALNGSCGGRAPEAVCYYFWIHRDDLTDANFDEVWLCVQQD